METAVLAPVFGETYRRAKNSQSSEEFVKSKEATSTGIVGVTEPRLKIHVS